MWIIVCYGRGYVILAGDISRYAVLAGLFRPRSTRMP